LKNGWIRRVFSGSLALLAIVALAGCGDDDDDGAVVPVRHSISGQVTLDNGSGLPGVTMALTGASSENAITDDSGNYTFDNLANGSYTITPSLTGFTFSPTDNTQIVSGADIPGVNFTATATVVSTVVTMFASLDNTQETPPASSTARGFGMLTLDTATNRISGFIFDNVANATAAHIHGPAARGTPADVLVPMIPAGPGLWVLPDNATLPAENAADFANGLLYYNVHTAANTAGEIRGQLDFP